MHISPDDDESLEPSDPADELLPLVGLSLDAEEWTENSLVSVLLPEPDGREDRELVTSSELASDESLWEAAERELG